MDPCILYKQTSNISTYIMDSYSNYGWYWEKSCFLLTLYGLHLCSTFLLVSSTQRALSYNTHCHITAACILHTTYTHVLSDGTSGVIRGAISQSRTLQHTVLVIKQLDDSLYLLSHNRLQHITFFNEDWKYLFHSPQPSCSEVIFYLVQILFRNFNATSQT